MAEQNVLLAGTPSVPKISRWNDARRTEWDAYIARTEDGTFFHLSGWKTIFEEVFRFKTHYLIAEQNGRITGVLPCVEQNSLLFGRGLIAAPFCVEGGPCGDPASREALDRAAQDLMAQTRSSYIEFRSHQASRAGWQVKSNLYAKFIRPLSADHEANLQAIPRKQRAVVRKALQSDLTVSVERDPKRFYAVYARSVQNLGTPVFGLRYFRRLCEIFGEQCDIVVVSDNGVAVSAVLNFYFKDTVLPYYGGGTVEARRSGANDLMYWETMRHAADRGFRRFDFGRSKAGTGAFAFKKNWGFEPEWLQYDYWLADGAVLPDNNAASPKYSLLVNSWKRLPAFVADALGPLLTRHLN
jgi:FemAB-related protein (PEP-CTERM system-associated)